MSCSPLARAKLNLERDLVTDFHLSCSYNSSISSKIPLWSHEVLDASAFLFLTPHMLVKSKLLKHFRYLNTHLNHLYGKASFREGLAFLFSSSGSFWIPVSLCTYKTELIFCFKKLGDWYEDKTWSLKQDQTTEDSHQIAGVDSIG